LRSSSNSAHFQNTSLYSRIRSEIKSESSTERGVASVSGWSGWRRNALSGPPNKVVSPPSQGNSLIGSSMVTICAT
jgi:hypothetical protein